MPAKFSISDSADGVHQMSLAHSDAAVDEQRIVGPCRRGRDRLRGGVRELIAGTDHEVVEGELDIDLAGWTLEQ